MNGPATNRWFSNNAWSSIRNCATRRGKRSLAAPQRCTAFSARRFRRCHRSSTSAAWSRISATSFAPTPSKWGGNEAEMTNAQIDFVLRVMDADPELTMTVESAMVPAAMRHDDIEVARITERLIEELRREDLAALWTEHFGAWF